MFNRVFKRSVAFRSYFNQHENRKSLFFYISFSGFEVVPYSVYFRNKKKYIITDSFSRYKACVLHKRQCNSFGVPINSFNNIIKKRNRLKRKKVLVKKRLFRF